MTTPDPNSPAEPNRPEDTRPRPQYGELAPEGWSWTPPQDQAVAPVAPNGPAIPVAVTAVRTVRAPAWDRPVTLGLLVFGLLATFFLVSVLGALPEAMQVLYTQEDLGTYTPAASVAGLIIAGRLVEAGIWLVTAVASILLVTRGRRSFYVPLIGGAVSIVAIFVFIGVVLTTDPTLLELYSRP
ncbi:DUF6264 family protein [Cryobacterium tagatosivorans]|uniref:Uncharacterized protein n=1 Tax=Cryobacterium tagatosivorans TaxID=1259199 RepID=A0A4R8UEY0_9MICO|nr:DUF6264 family protein [Cryobacterium tagatosivorans]TFB50394.1 hypothetical protein E3O23_09625 [Cryobacterium tagatosivorans]